MHIFNKPNYDFLRWRWHALALSWLIIIAGIVTIGPNCPGPETTTCPTQPSAYAARKILVYTETKSNLLFTVDIDSQGAYFIDLAPGKYTIDLKPSGIDKTSDLPKLVEIHANTVTSLNVSIDTGIR